jgi:hypothetical protein
MTLPKSGLATLGTFSVLGIKPKIVVSKLVVLSYIQRGPICVG